MWQHDCPLEGKIEVGDDEPCNWCSAVKPPKVEDATLPTQLTGLKANRLGDLL